MCDHFKGEEHTEHDQLVNEQQSKLDHSTFEYQNHEHIGKIECSLPSQSNNTKERVVASTDLASSEIKELNQDNLLEDHSINLVSSSDGQPVPREEVADDQIQTQPYSDSGKNYGDAIEFHTQDDRAFDQSVVDCTSDLLEQYNDDVDMLDQQDTFFAESQMLGRPYDAQEKMEEYSETEASFMNSGHKEHVDSSLPIPAMNEIQNVLSNSFEELRKVYEKMQKKVSDTAYVAISSRANSFSNDDNGGDRQNDIELLTLRTSIQESQSKCESLEMMLEQSSSDALHYRNSRTVQLTQFKEIVANMKTFVNGIRQATYSDLSTICQEAFDLVASFKSDAEVQLANAEVINIIIFICIGSLS